ncbi:hypothetical protein B0T22DRAFT_478103 [Podospora appendiculata]|uniref:C3H1-type domain-containing protein n=1 Tax=Podospora appendiculata TaxID=314037 RepID=A0AAE1CI24_9PEZI|nr:hypothetical protein B0T22DRAFT_478103 [Podospora appendiculata]
MTPSPSILCGQARYHKGEPLREGVVRERGRIVPLVAVDQFPEWLSIIGIPRELTSEQIVGMHDLGTIAKDEGTYAIQITHTSYSSSWTPEHAVVDSAAASLDSGRPEIGKEDNPVQEPMREEAERKPIERDVCISQEGDVLPCSCSMCLTPSSTSSSSASSSQASSLTILPSLPPLPFLASQTASPRSIQAQFAAFQNSPVLNRDTSNTSDPQPDQIIPPPTNTHLSTKKASKKHTPPSPPASLATDSSSTTTTTHKTRGYCCGWVLHGQCKHADSCRYLHAQPESAEGVVRLLRQQQQNLDKKREAKKPNPQPPQQQQNTAAAHTKKYPSRKNVKLTYAERAAINADRPVPLRGGVGTCTERSGGGDIRGAAGGEEEEVKGKAAASVQGVLPVGEKPQQQHVLPAPQRRPGQAEIVEEASLITFEKRETVSVISSSSVPLVAGKEQSVAPGASSRRAPTPTDLLD